jgi:uncharacterized membrane protein YfcA
MMSGLHALKIVTFGLLGFAFAPYLPLMAGMVASVSVGSWVGTHLRPKVPEELFRQLLKVALTLLALRLIMQVAV